MWGSLWCLWLIMPHNCIADIYSSGSWCCFWLADRCSCQYSEPDAPVHLLGCLLMLPHRNRSSRHLFNSTQTQKSCWRFNLLFTASQAFWRQLDIVSVCYPRCILVGCLSPVCWLRKSGGRLISTWKRQQVIIKVSWCSDLSGLMVWSSCKWLKLISALPGDV